MKSSIRFASCTIILMAAGSGASPDGYAESATSDRQEIADHATDVGKPTSGPDSAVAPGESLGLPAVQELVGGIDSQGQVTKWLGLEPAPQRSAEIEPKAVVYVRLSREMLERNVARNVSRRKPVRDLILGTRIVGESQTDGEVHLVLDSSDRTASGSLEFAGTVHAKTLGYNGPAIIHYDSATSFQVRKPFVIDAAGLHIQDAEGSAPTKLTPTHIETKLTGFRGRIVERIAWKRVRESQTAADGIASEHTVATLRDDLDRGAADSFARMESTLRPQIDALAQNWGEALKNARLRSTPECVELVIVNQHVDNDAEWPNVPLVDGNPDLMVCVDRSVAARVASDSLVMELIASSMGSLLGPDDAQVAQDGANPMAILSLADWSLGLKWVSLKVPDFRVQEQALMAESE